MGTTPHRGEGGYKDGRALRIETVINDTRDLRCNRMLTNLDEVQTKARAITPSYWRLKRRLGARHL